MLKKILKRNNQNLIKKIAYIIAGLLGIYRIIFDMEYLKTILNSNTFMEGLRRFIEMGFGVFFVIIVVGVFAISIPLIFIDRRISDLFKDEINTKIAIVKLIFTILLVCGWLYIFQDFTWLI